jgi:uncharacterized phage protein (TIGR02216 family)
MAFGLGVLKLTPAAFWAMTLSELAAVVRVITIGENGLRRVRLAELMDRFPDN